MEEPLTVWERLGHWLKPGGRRDEPLSPGLSDNEAAEDRWKGPAGREGQHRTGVLGRWARRDQVLQQIQEDHGRVLALMDTIQRYVGVQERRSEEMAESLRRVAEALADAPEARKQQTEILSEIASQMVAISDQSKATAEAIPKMVGKHTELLSSIHRQLEVAGDANAGLACSLSAAGASLDSLGASSQAQLEALQKLHESAARQNEPLADLIARQSRRFVLLFALMLTIMIVLTGLVGAAIWYPLGRL